MSEQVTFFVDDVDSWILPYARTLQINLESKYFTRIVHRVDDIPHGDILLILGCTTILREDILERNRYNFVVHESALPLGRGWSPVSWQILEGKNLIPITLFIANRQVDAGDIVLTDTIVLDGTELLPEIKQKQGQKTVDIVMELFSRWPTIQNLPQFGKSSYYKKRTRKDDKLDVNKTISENFNLLRIADNEEHPAWFELNGIEYILKIYKADIPEKS